MLHTKKWNKRCDAISPEFVYDCQKIGLPYFHHQKGGHLFNEIY